MSIEEEQNHKLLVKISQTQEETLKFLNKVYDTLETLNDLIKDNQDELLKKTQTLLGKCDILEKNQKTIWQKVLELAEEETEPTEET